MKIEIDDDLRDKVQTLTTLHLDEPEYTYFVDFLARVGYATVRAALHQHPELTFGDLVMIRYRNRH